MYRHQRRRRGRRNETLFLSVLSLVVIVLASTASALLIVPDPIVHFGIGAVAGGCGAVAYQPFDYIKAQMQVQRQEGGSTSRNNEQDRQLPFENGFDCLIQTLQNSPTDLFRGLTVSVTGVAPEKSIKLGVNDILKDYFATTLLLGGAASQSLPLWCQITAGAVAGSCQVLVSSPLDAVKIRLQTRSRTSSVDDSTGNNNRPVVEAWKEVTGGPDGMLGGLYKGADACWIRDVSFTAVCLPLYSSLVVSGLDPFVAGALSGVASTFIATPADMVKTRILMTPSDSSSNECAVEVYDPALFMMDMNVPTAVPEALSMQRDSSLAARLYPMRRNNTMTSPFAMDEYSSLLAAVNKEVISSSNVKSKTPKQKPHTNPFRVAKTIFNEEGASALFSGVSERCIGAVPRFGITLGVHEWLEQYASHAGLLS